MMAGHRAILVRTAAGYGIVTDSDLRRRVLAEGWSSDRRIADAMTFPIRVVAPDRPVDDVALEMLEAGVHHLPVVDQEAVVGMVSDLELLHLQRRTPFALRNRIDSAQTPEELAAAGRAFPRAAVDLWRSGVDAAQVGLWLSALTDRLTVRLLDAELARLGPAPVGWAWLTLGSVGRREQALTADQDHALIYANQGEVHDAYFAALASGVVSALAAAGFPECESRVMSTDPGWRMSLENWLSRIDQWMSEPDRLHSFLSGIMFDYRQIAGSLDVVPDLDRMTAKAASNPRFIKRMGGLARAHQSPLRHYRPSQAHRRFRKSGVRHQRNRSISNHGDGPDFGSQVWRHSPFNSRAPSSCGRRPRVVGGQHVPDAGIQDNATGQISASGRTVRRWAPARRSALSNT